MHYQVMHRSLETTGFLQDLRCAYYYHRQPVFFTTQEQRTIISATNICRELCCVFLLFVAVLWCWIFAIICHHGRWIFVRISTLRNCRVCHWKISSRESGMFATCQLLMSDSKLSVHSLKCLKILVMFHVFLNFSTERRPFFLGVYGILFWI